MPPLAARSLNPTADVWSHRNELRHLQRRLNELNGEKKPKATRRRRQKVKACVLPNLHSKGATATSKSNHNQLPKTTSKSIRSANPLAAESMRVTPYEKHLEKVSTICFGVTAESIFIGAPFGQQPYNRPTTPEYGAYGHT